MSKFELGRTVVTKGVSRRMEEHPDFRSFVNNSINRYSKCDWGDTRNEDKETANHAVEHGERILAVYKHDKFPDIWIITEWDRSVTTVLFPDEY